MDTSIGSRIKSRRNELNITQQQIQERIGISSGNMSGIESGKSLPSATALINLSKVLKCSIDWMLTGLSPISENFTLSCTEENLINNFRKLTENDKDELLDIVELKLRRMQKLEEKNSYKSSDLANFQNKKNDNSN